MTCPGCERHEWTALGTFYDFSSEAGWTPKRLVFDCDALYAMLQRNPRPVAHDDHDNPNFAAMVAGHEMFDEHIDHVPYERPILMGLFTFTHSVTGERKQFHLCLDGHHRIAKRLRLGFDIEFYLMTEEEMRAASYESYAAYMRSKGMVLIGLSDEEVEKVVQEGEAYANIR